MQDTATNYIHVRVGKGGGGTAPWRFIPSVNFRRSINRGAPMNTIWKVVKVDGALRATGLDPPMR